MLDTEKVLAALNDVLIDVDELNHSFDKFKEVCQSCCDMVKEASEIKREKIEAEKFWMKREEV